jgi:hypothetical protein
MRRWPVVELLDRSVSWGSPRIMLRLVKLSLGATAAVVVAVASLGGLNLYTYQRFTAELPVAEVAFTGLTDHRFEARIETAGQPVRRFFLEGDEWQMDVRMIKWTDWLTFLGTDPLFRLDRISGRYSEIDEARAMSPSMYALIDEPGIDLWSFARASGAWLPGIDAAYGTSVFLPMRDGQRYVITMSRTGLVGRALYPE